MKNFLTTAILFAFCSSLSAQWQKTNADFQVLDIDAIDSSTLWSMNFNTGNIARTTNGGTTWGYHDIPNAAGFLLRAFISANDSSKAWVGFHHYNSGINYVYRTLDGGQSWQQRTPAALDNAQIINYLKFYTSNKGIVLSHDFNGHLFVYRTTNGGQSWSSKTLVINGSHLGTTIFGDQNIWFYTGSGELWRSNDGGENWSTFQTGLIATSYGLSMAFADGLHGLAFKNRYFNELYRTADGGASWQPVFDADQPAPSTAFIVGLSKIPGSPGAWILGSNDGTAYTLDDGDHWIFENNYPDHDFGKPDFLNARQGWGYVVGAPGVYKWQEEAMDSSLIGCVQFLGPLKTKLRRSDCDKIWYQGSIRADITGDPGIHLRARLFYPDNVSPFTQSQIYHNIQTGCQDCPYHFVPDSGQTTVGEIQFDIPVWHASDTSQVVICIVSPTQCAEDTTSAVFHTGYFANWFHPECFQIDTSDCAIELITNACGIDTNHYLIYYRVQDGFPVIGTHYEKNPSYKDHIRFYIFAFGDYNSSTCSNVIEAFYTCGTSGASAPSGSNAVRLFSAPNPAGETFQFFCDHLPEQQIHTIRIKNAAGVEVWSQTLPQGADALSVDRHLLPGGFYVAELWSDHKLMALSKLVLVKIN